MPLSTHRICEAVLLLWWCRAYSRSFQLSRVRDLLSSLSSPAECPSLRIQQQAGGGGQKCYNCGRFGHIARACPSGALSGPAFASRPPPPGRGLNTSTLPPVKCYRCGGPNHMARDCLAAVGTTMDSSIPTGPASMKSKTCYKCQQEGHIARECPENADFMG
ncbi:hypothetical protein MVEN_01248600 [Mycena venus]|uniref:CCHC-type domain-containing protein n=1 Tax=Mycena venus TaxID=2733690 RepID=A0A8H6Y536_9AGAR|nr:hypothetical protein MVEN_01248600 [Mycena venus]